MFAKIFEQEKKHDHIKEHGKAGLCPYFRYSLNPYGDTDSMAFHITNKMLKHALSCVECLSLRTIHSCKIVNKDSVTKISKTIWNNGVV